VLIVSIVLAIAPLLGIAYIAAQGSIATVDNLFTILILLALSGIFAANGAMDLRRRMRGGAVEPADGAQFAASGLHTQRGLVESVLFFESPVGQPDKSIVTFRPKGSKQLQMLSFEGDLRNLLPSGHQVELTYQLDGGRTARVLALNYK
jgi:hypothetical protein